MPGGQDLGIVDTDFGIECEFLSYPYLSGLAMKLTYSAVFVLMSIAP